MLQRIIVAISILMALAVLGLLMLKSQAPPQDLSLHIDRIGKITRIQQLNSELDQEISKARLGLESEPKTLAEAQQRLQTAEESFSESSGSLSAIAPRLDRDLRNYLQSARDKERLLQDYRAQLTAFAGEFQHMREQGDQTLTNLPISQQGQTRKQVMALLVEATGYCIQSAPTNGPSLERLIAALKDEAAGSGNASLHERLERLAQTVRAVRSAKDSMQSNSESLLAVPVADSLQTLRSDYYAYYSTQESSVSRYRLLLAIYASALLAVFGLVGWRLRNSYGALDSSNAQLQDANAHLEESVEARTQELRNALNELRLQQAQLVQSEKMASLGQMVAGVAHEINTPLGYARSNVETVRESMVGLRELIERYEVALQSPAETGIAADHIEAIRSSRDRWDPNEGLDEVDALLSDADHGLGQIAELVMSLKDFSRVDRSKTELFDLNDGLEMALKICQSQFKHRVEIRKDYGELPRIPCAPSQLNQVFLNILTNAAQSIEGEGWIRIQTRDAGETVEIAIADNGCGMDAQTQAHIFEPFFTTKEVGQGTGLGLSIVFRIIEDHRGSIRVNSTPGKGTEFVISLPKPSSALPKALASDTHGSDATEIEPCAA